MKKLIVAGCVVIAGSAAVVAGVAARHEPTYAPGVQLAGTDLSGKKPSDAGQVLDRWWERERNRTIKLTSDELKKPGSWTLEVLGARLDREATLAQLSTEDVWAATTRQMGMRTASTLDVQPVIRFEQAQIDEIAAFVQRARHEPRQARVLQAGGGFTYQTESSGVELDASRLQSAVEEAMQGAGTAKMPLKVAPKRVPDDALRSIGQTVSTFATNFSAGNVPRSHNIRLATELISGHVLMPGDRLSFNETVGQRTAKRGFRMAGVYVMGRSDFDFGGGICQVSSTMYNAALLAGLKIVQRRPHSKPVPYVPVGRDATVNWGSIDLVIENNRSTPIAMIGNYAPGRLTFTVLGAEGEPGERVVIERTNQSSAPPKVQVVNDPTLPLGKEVVKEPGSASHRVTTYRVTYRGDVEVKRESLGTSVYPGAKRVVARNTTGVEPAPKPSPTPKPPAPSDDEAEAQGDPASAATSNSP